MFEIVSVPDVDHLSTDYFLREGDRDERVLRLSGNEQKGL